MSQNQLDEKGWIFLGANGKPYLCCLWGDIPWLFFWHADDHWVSLKPVSQNEVFAFPHNLTDEEQNFYRLKHEEFNKQFQFLEGKDL